ncbi:hypothetical protein DTO164E3_6901 [Paecilomyces variotii]|nr:hypothetical protein DTO032I3_9194 [Paecilomyces variotii]KAJ9195365.1 hypothetical protein DTO164E3_6901 [Paecilomyces variotii]KAJ9269587.1 hypothetical protein DTO212C5_4438 [Paecilomyces variotii]KAJ9273933.1 hypothetical protein DTO021D3_9204 [Paecilomyces variotii]KAJ9338254.1 hypothetical protein DTO027B6_9194 [Paecilomyces variotii]
MLASDSPRDHKGKRSRRVSSCNAARRMPSIQDSFQKVCDTRKWIEERNQHTYVTRCCYTRASGPAPNSNIA